MAERTSSVGMVGAGENLRLRVGLAVAGGAAAFAAARCLGFIGDCKVRWCKSEDAALAELRLDRQGRQSTIPGSPILVSESQLASHRGYR